MGTSVISLVSYALSIYQIILLGRVLLSWVPNMDYRNPIVRFLYAVTEPILEPIRRMLPTQGGMDFSPLIVFLGIAVLNQILGRLA
ncbi:MAG: YggT family protein [Anaerolineae bacterium]